MPLADAARAHQSTRVLAGWWNDVANGDRGAWMVATKDLPNPEAAVDVAQVRSVAHLSSVRVVQHATFHHNVPAYLEREGLLVPMVRSEVVGLVLGGAVGVAAGAAEREANY